MTRTIAVAHPKGGVGKSTTTANLAAALAEEGKKVLVVDLDAFHGATDHFGQCRSRAKGLLALLVDHARPASLSSLAQPTFIRRIDIVPASRWLYSADRLLSVWNEAETLLQRATDPRDLSRWDYVIYDCPPGLGLLTINALVAVRELFVPVSAQYCDQFGLTELTHTVRRVKEQSNPSLEITGVVMCRVTGTAMSRMVVNNVRNRFGRCVFQTVVRENTKIARAPMEGKPITRYDANGRGASDYRSLACEVIEQEKGRV